MTVRDTFIGSTGTVATFGLGEMNLAIGIVAGLLTCVYMVLTIRRELRKK
jgi:hypothetical protein